MKPKRFVVEHPNTAAMIADRKSRFQITSNSNILESTSNPTSPRSFASPKASPSIHLPTLPPPIIPLSDPLHNLLSLIENQKQAVLNMIDKKTPVYNLSNTSPSVLSLLVILY